jgi:hypothetical protein
MAEALHSLQTPTEGVHVPYHYSVADATARAALSPVAADVGKLVLQQDTDELWMITAVTPTFIKIGGGTGQVELMGDNGWPSTSNGCGGPTKTEWTTNDVDLQVLAFDQGSTEYAQWTKFLHDWDGGTVTAVFYWTATGGAGGEAVRLGLQGRGYINDDAIDQAWGTAKEVDDDWIANDDVHVTAATAAITIAGNPESGALVQFRAYCDSANSDLSSDCLLLAIVVTYGKT